MVYHTLPIYLQQVALLSQRGRTMLHVCQHSFNSTKRRAQSFFWPHDAMHKRGLCCHAVSVCLSVTFEDTVKTNKLIFKSFSPSGSKAILVIFLLEPHNRGVECRWGRQKSRFWAYIWLHCMLSTLRPARCYQHAPPNQCPASCDVVFGVTLRLFVINISSSSLAINKLRRLLPAISTWIGTWIYIAP